MAEVEQQPVEGDLGGRKVNVGAVLARTQQALSEVQNRNIVLEVMIDDLEAENAQLRSELVAKKEQTEEAQA